jgi:hypothetical protein
MLYVFAAAVLVAFAAVCLMAWMMQEIHRKQMAELKAIRDAVEDIERRMIISSHASDFPREQRRRW